MNYYGIVDKIKDKHKPGIYGKRALKKGETLKDLENDCNNDLLRDILKGVMQNFSPFLVYHLLKKNKERNKKITLQHKLENEDFGLIFPFELFDNNFRIENSKELFYVLFDEYTFSEKLFSTLMISNGGSIFTILQKDKVKFKHFGGENGKFSNGIYVTHPKDKEILLPLRNFNNLIKSMILEETIQAYEALGAKRMVIEDHTNIGGEISGVKKGVKGKANVDYQKQILREKTFGKGIFDPERALKDKYFIHDFPNIINTLNARIHGNQTKEIFSETVNLNAGLDVGVLEIFSGGAKFNYTRKWYFEVEFYDKNEF